MFQINVFYHRNKVTIENYGQALGTFCNKHIFTRSSQEQPLPSGEGKHVLGAQHMAPVMDGAAKKWQYCLCGKVSKLKGDILDHVECKHMNNAFLYSCRYCTMVVGTNRKLRLHEVESCISLLLTLSE